MKYRTNDFCKYVFAYQLAFLILFGVTTVAFAQNLREPNVDKALNGLKILVFNEPANPQTTVKLRVHSGAAFDPKDKTGVMRLLADAMLPDEATRQFYEEELNGKISIESNYDFIEITAQGRTEDFTRILETLQNAVTNTNLTQENFVKLREARLKAINEDAQNPNYVADLAVRNRLYGNYPYGKPMNGNAESLTKIDRFDLITARDKFVTADNSTIAIIGNVKPTYAFRAVRQLFGSWKKADKLVPATFRQPDAPKTETLKIETPISKTQIVKNLTNAVSRNDKDFFVTQLFVELNRKIYCLYDETKRGEMKLEPHLLRSFLFTNYNQVYTDAPKELPIYSGPCMLFLVKSDEKKVRFPDKFPQSVLDEVKTKVITEFQSQTQSTLSLAEMWLDVDTFKLTPIKEQLKSINAVTLNDVQKVAENLNKQPFASVATQAQTQK